jgi:hypothetical protein
MVNGESILSIPWVRREYEVFFSDGSGEPSISSPRSPSPQEIDDLYRHSPSTIHHPPTPKNFSQIFPKMRFMSDSWGTV